MNQEELAKLVEEILASMGQEPQVKGSDYKTLVTQEDRKNSTHGDGDFVPDVTALDLRKLYLTENPAHKSSEAGRGNAKQINTYSIQLKIPFVKSFLNYLLLKQPQNSL